MCVIGQPIALV